MWDLSSRSRDRTHIPCVGRWILDHWTTSEVPCYHLFKSSVARHPDPAAQGLLTAAPDTELLQKVNLDVSPQKGGIAGVLMG